MIRALAIVLGGSLFLAALFTGPLYGFIQGSDAGFLHIFARYPFSRVFDRVWMVSAALLLGLQYRAFCFGPVFESLRGEGRLFGRRLSLGLLWALSSGLVALYGLVLLGELLGGSDVDLARLSLKVLGLVPAALLIACIEEIFFRGLLLQSLRQAAGTRIAILGSSLLYSVVHFVQPQKGFTVIEPSIYSGFEYLSVLGSSIAATNMLCAVVGLFFVGLTLSTIVVRYGHLSSAIGLHAGWVMVIKLAVWLTELPPDATLPHRFFIVAHPIGWGIVSMTPFVFALVWRTRPVAPKVTDVCPN